MTAEEAIEILKDDKGLYESEVCYAGDGTPDGDLIQALDMAIEALETISELEKRGITVDTINEYKIFEDECVRKGFTFESLLEAREKQTPKKTYIQQDDRNNDCIECPSCDSFIGYEYDCRDEHYQINYCPYCGQALDWSEEE